MLRSCNFYIQIEAIGKKICTRLRLVWNRVRTKSSKSLSGVFCYPSLIWNSVENWELTETRSCRSALVLSNQRRLYESRTCLRCGVHCMPTLWYTACLRCGTLHAYAVACTACLRCGVHCMPTLLYTACLRFCETLDLRVYLWFYFIDWNPRPILKDLSKQLK